MKDETSSLDLPSLRSFLQQSFQSLTCSICQELMYVPYTIVCGHSFCYGCLKEWFNSKLTCPFCRQKVTKAPIANLTVRELVAFLVVALKSQNLAKQKSQAILEHELEQKEETLFHGKFGYLVETILDASDGVERCSRCHWELHGERCLNCGAVFLVEEGSEDNEGREDAEESEIGSVASWPLHYDTDNEDDIGSSAEEDTGGLPFEREYQRALRRVREVERLERREASEELYWYDESDSGMVQEHSGSEASWDLSI